ncbi:MAG: hypothetical protein KF760_34095 [Candidatus Eremiobacteraeota bacterium]|nr:hypothetical protein [Candidatus Eremiobacteraeota bacterium]
MGILGKLVLFVSILVVASFLADVAINEPVQVETVLRRGEAKQYVQRGDLFFKEGNFAKAWIDYTRAIHLDYSYGKPWLQRGRVRLQQGRFLDARRQLILCMLKELSDEERAESFYLDAYCLKQLGEYSSAISSARACLELNSNHWAAQVLLGELQQRNRDTKTPASSNS